MRGTAFAHRQVDRLHVDRHDAVEVVLAHVFQRLRQVRDAGVVDEDVDAAEVLHRPRPSSPARRPRCATSTRSAPARRPPGGGHVQRGLLR
jgi:hypothetical protein